MERYNNAFEGNWREKVRQFISDVARFVKRTRVLSLNGFAINQNTYSKHLRGVFVNTQLLSHSKCEVASLQRIYGAIVT